jgi:DUF1365 family protein
MHSCLYVGQVNHRRHGGGDDPVSNAFTYRLFMVYLDLGELDRVFRGRWLWSTRRRAPAWLRREDHLGDPAVPLQQAVRDLVQARTGRRPAGPVRMLTHLRYFGHCFNPVTFYYCYDAAGTEVDAVVCEVNNTPWGEQHCYVLPRDAARVRGPSQEFELEKEFHVSPFLPMQTHYRWRFTAPGPRLLVHLRNEEARGHAFDATLSLERREITGRSLAAALARFPFMTLRVVTLIYWQALKLKLKGAVFHTHPSKRAAGLEKS